MEQKDSARIDGRFHLYPGRMVLLHEISVEGRYDIDSMLTDPEGKFTFSFPVNEAGFFVITLGETIPLVLMVEGGDEIKLDCEVPNTQTGCTIEGSAGSTIIRDYYIHTGRNRDLVDTMRMVLEAAKAEENFNEVRKSLDSDYALILKDQRRFTKKMIESHMGSLTSIFMSNQRFGPNRLFSFEFDLPMYEKMDSILSVNYPGNPHVLDQKNRMKKFIVARDEQAEAERKLSPGNAAPVVSLPALDGTSFSLNSLHGNYVLLYFWAAYDATSRKYNTNVLPISRKFKGQDLKVVAISMDDRRPVWEGAVHLDNLNTAPIVTNISDLKGANSPLIKIYNLGERLPVLYLLDKEGIILAKLDKNDDLEKTLNENLNP